MTADTNGTRENPSLVEIRIEKLTDLHLFLFVFCPRYAMFLSRGAITFIQIMRLSLNGKMMMAEPLTALLDPKIEFLWIIFRCDIHKFTALLLRPRAKPT